MSLYRAYLVSAILVFVQLLQITLQSEDAVLRETDAGMFRGIRKNILYRNVDVFLGIPYAQPPIDNLRFQPPQPIKGTSAHAIFVNATKLPRSCWQEVDTSFGGFPGMEMWKPNTGLSEDCLYLNVWQPMAAENKTESTLKAVMIWIHGGGFCSGTSTLNLYDGGVLASIGNVVVVSFQYRLGPFGFAYLGTKMAPGNVGLLDQHAAIEWVHKNIRAFGGDNDRITIFGESAGAASVSIHISSPMSNTLFKSAILQSGSATRDWALIQPSEAKQRTTDLAGQIGCNVTTNEVTIECLKKAEAAALSKGQWKIFTGKSFFRLPFAPTIDGVFLKKSPKKFVADGKFKQKSILLGYTRDEGSFLLAYYLNKEDHMDSPTMTPAVNQHVFLDAVNAILNHVGTSLVKKVMQVYGAPNNTVDYISVMSEMTGDKNFKCPVESLAYGAALKMPVYLYEFDHRTSANPWAEWMGVMHGYEIDHVFGIPLIRSGYTEQEKLFSRALIQYWTNFAKSGNPNENDDGYPTSGSKWPTFTGKEKNVMHLKTSDSKSDKPTVRDKFCNVLREIDDSKAVRQFIATPLVTIAASVFVFLTSGIFF